MRIEPQGKLAELLMKARRADLLSGFDVDDEFLQKHEREVFDSHPEVYDQPEFMDASVEELRALAIYSAYFHPNAPHNSAARKPDSVAPEPGRALDGPPSPIVAAIERASLAAEATAVATRTVIAQAIGKLGEQMEARHVENVARAKRFRKRGALYFAVLLGLLFVMCVRGKAQSSGGVILRGSNGASVLVTRSAGLLTLKCDGTTVTCAWSAATNTITISAASSISNFYTSTVSTGIGPTSFAPTHTLDVYDATASTGATNLGIRAGAGDSSGAVLTFYKNDGTSIIGKIGAGFLGANFVSFTTGASGRFGFDFGGSTGGTLIAVNDNYFGTNDASWELTVRNPATGYVDIVSSNGLGMVIGTVSAIPLYWSYNGTKVAQRNSTGFVETGNITALSGANTVFRCATAGATLPVGSLTINSAACGTTTDTGYRTN